MLRVNKNFCLLFFLLFNFGCTNSNQMRFQLSEESNVAWTHAEDSRILDGKLFPGKIRARGIIGLFSVEGVLSFENGMLIWEAEGSKDIGAYQTIEQEGNILFSARLTIENNEQVAWSGSYDGKNLHQVQALWVRNKGDLIHDLFLPGQVTLDFTPAQE